jgi:hypothetical protein
MIERLARLSVPPAARAELALPRGALHLRRSWARSADHLLLEYVSVAGAPVAGQWMRDGAALERVARETGQRCPDAPCALVECDAGPVLLQPRGADRRLDGLAELCAAAGTELVAHRPERRAVVRDRRGPDTRYVKVVRPSMVGRVLEPAVRLGAFDRPFALPRPVQVDEARGWLVCTALPGRSLFDLLGGGAVLDRGLAPAVGSALRWMHDREAAGLPSHTADAEIELVRECCARVAILAPGLSLGPAARAVAAGLEGVASPPVPLHRDLHDKQILVDEGNALGLLDLDTMAAGEAALDLANLLAHLELRQLQARCTPGAAAAFAGGLMQGYRPGEAVARRLAAYLDSARLRLACVYALRPRWATLPPDLIRRIGAAPPGRWRRPAEHAAPASTSTHPIPREIPR